MLKKEEYAQMRKVKGQSESFHDVLSIFHSEFYCFINRSSCSRSNSWFLEECRQNSCRISFQEEDKNNIAPDEKHVQITLAISISKTTVM